MSTEDVPGYKPENRDRLAMGCWAEHEDGSLILVEDTEGGRIVYLIFDVARKPIIQYRDTMAQGAFEKTYSWAPEKKRGKDDAWTWHDKTVFPWDRVIADGFRDGASYADVEDQLSEAERIARRRRQDRNEDYSENAAQRARHNREIQSGKPVDPYDIEHRIERTMGKAAAAMVATLQAAVARLKPGAPPRRRK
jgi:hypothetical protein